ncbi:MAG: RsmE family RNA methyltransferase [Bacteroidia bacterium]|nr:RsmE family RNA methyltransferase [Bacteroidia bacterium]
MQIFIAEMLDATTARLDAEESRHCVQALRHKIGDRITCVDGAGTMLAAEIQAILRDEVRVTILARTADWGEVPGKRCLAVSPLHDRDRFEWLIEKSVELGVTDIIPIQCHRTDPYKSRYKEARIQTIIRTALKQCKRSRLPILHPLTPLMPWLRDAHTLPGWMAWCEADTPLQDFGAIIAASTDISLLIGPEGDFTAEEVAAARAAGWHTVSLGDQRLRSETAGLYALTAVKWIQGY